MLDNRNIHRFRSLDVCFEIFLKEHAAKILFELLSRVVRNSGSIKASNNSFVPSRRTGKQRTSIDSFVRAVCFHIFHVSLNNAFVSITHP